jgi:L-rhamnose mutarotase
VKTITLKKREDINYKDHIRRSALEADFSTLLTEECICIDEDKNILFIYCTLPFDYKEVVTMLDRVNYDKTARSSGLQTTSKIFGYMPRITMRSDYCRTTKFALEQPQEHAVIAKYGIKIAGLYHRFSPEVYKAHESLLKEKVLDEYALRDTPFTSGIINKNNPLKYHFDSGNFKGVYSAMTVFKRDVEGGYLSIPEYDVGVELENNSLFMFDGQNILHGVTPIKRTSDNAKRYSIVYYSLQQMWNCLPIDEEVARIRDLKTEREQRRWGKLKTQELTVEESERLQVARKKVSDHQRSVAGRD